MAGQPIHRNSVWLLIVVTGLAVIAVILVTRRHPRPLPTPEPGPTPKAAEAEQDAAPKPAPESLAIEFSPEGLAGKLATEVQRVVGKGNAQVAVLPRGEARWVCILADAGTPERYAEFDQGLSLDDFPDAERGGFRPPPPQIARTTTSIYRSVAKTAMGYDPARGDRIVIFLCPRADWPKLALHWPATAR